MVYFADAINLPLPFDAFINYLWGVEVGKSSYKIIVGQNCITQSLTVMLLHCSFICVLLCSILLFLRVSSSSVLLCSPHHVDLPFVTPNQCHDAPYVGRIHGDTMTFPLKVFKHDVVEVDPLLKNCSVLMLGVQILVSFASIVGPDKELLCP